jgi:hypothetical protein
MQHNLCGKYFVGNVIYHEKAEKSKTQETKNAEINNIVYMELYSGAKMVNEKDLKTKYVRSKNREFILYCSTTTTHSRMNKFSSSFQGACRS